jgi:hypothetical protein
MRGMTALAMDAGDDGDVGMSPTDTAFAFTNMPSAKAGWPSVMHWWILRRPFRPLVSRRFLAQVKRAGFLAARRSPPSRNAGYREASQLHRFCHRTGYVTAQP